ncbi:hypothetical protein CW304_04895 [Bacillus sp. UFRGS-B20]|nr:hypothetical protein CW304_04895 [Bacillus sp. UFRGS-B20]
MVAQMVFTHTFFSLNSSCVVLLVYYIFQTLLTLSLCIPVLFFFITKCLLANSNHSFYYNQC